MKYFVYVIENLKGLRYTGSTEDLPNRLAMHNDANPQKAKFHKTTYKKGPWKIIFCRKFKTRAETLHFEKYLKTGVGRNWLKRARHGG